MAAENEYAMRMNISPVCSLPSTIIAVQWKKRADSCLRMIHTIQGKQSHKIQYDLSSRQHNKKLQNLISRSMCCTTIYQDFGVSGWLLEKKCKSGFFFAKSSVQMSSDSCSVLLRGHLSTSFFILFICPYVRLYNWLVCDPLAWLTRKMQMKGLEITITSHVLSAQLWCLQ